MKKLYYIYANFPAYRKDFFTQLSKDLIRQNIQLEVLHGIPTDNKVVKQENDYLNYKKSFISKVINIGPLKFSKILRLAEYVKDNKPDAIVISYMSTNITMLRIIIFCLLHKIPYATWRCGYNRADYSNISAKLRGLFINFVEKRATINITYGSFYKKKLIEKGIPNERITIAQNTINVERILTENLNHKKQFTPKTRILFVGALIKGKFLKSSIDAVKRLVDENYNIQFDIVGGGEIIDELRKYTEELSMLNHINILGPKFGVDVKKYFKEADVFLLAGTGGLALNEAMAYGLPIITTNADGTGCDLIEGNGYLLENFGDVEMQYQYLKTFIGLSKEKKMEKSEQSIKIIKTKATLENMVDTHSKVCIKLLNI